MAAQRGIAPAAMVREIDETRTVANLSSAVRLAVLNWYRSGGNRAGP